MTKRTEHYKYASTSERLRFIREEDDIDGDDSFCTWFFTGLIVIAVALFTLLAWCWRVTQ